MLLLRAASVGNMVGLHLPVDTWRYNTMFIRRPQNLGNSLPTVIDFPKSMYFRPETGSLILVGLEDGNLIGKDPDGDTDLSRPGFCGKDFRSNMRANSINGNGVAAFRFKWI